MSQLSKGSSSTNPASDSCGPRRSGKARGIPRYCRCGAEATIKTSSTTKNPGRLFYCCPHGSEGDRYHLFTWTDERLVEEVEDLKVAVGELREELSILRSDMASLGKQPEQNQIIIASSADGTGGCCVL